MHPIFPQMQFPKHKQKTKPHSIYSQQIHHKKYHCKNYGFKIMKFFLQKKIGYEKLHKRTHWHKCAYT